MQVTRNDVARRAGVSAAVVSYVLNGGPRGVSADKAERVRRAVEELQYRPNSVARALRLQRSNTLGLIIQDAANPFFAELSRAIEDVAYERGYILLLGNSVNSADRERDYLRVFLERQVEGILFVSAATHAAVPTDRKGYPPVVALDRVPNAAAMSAVVVDNRAAARELVAHLIGHGHRRIALLGGPNELPTSRERLAGWRDALRTAGFAASPRLRTESAFTRPGGAAAMRELLGSTKPPTAVFAASEQQAIGALSELYAAGLRVPTDIAIGAVDGTEAAEFAIPPLTVVRQPVVEIARRAVDLVLQLARKPGPPRREVVPYQLVIRRSCGCIAEGTDRA